MNIIGTYETKTKLSEILNRVEHGESFTITRKGNPIAILAPVYTQGIDPGEVAKRLRAARQGTQLGRKVSIAGLHPTGAK
jgi:prevent-host-death family protein